MNVNINDYVIIKESVIDNKIATLRQEGKPIGKWNTYRNSIFKIIRFDNQQLPVIIDAKGNEIHISKNALEIVDIHEQ